MSGFSNSLSHFVRHPCHPNPIFELIYSATSQKSNCLIIRSISIRVSEYQTYNICNFATTYDGQTAEKVCPTYPPIYGATPPPPICSERK